MCPVGNKCFKLVRGTDNNRRTWVEALKICRSGPGQLPDLASVTSGAENGKTSYQSVRETTLIDPIHAAAMTEKKRGLASRFTANLRIST